MRFKSCWCPCLCSLISVRTASIAFALFGIFVCAFALISQTAAIGVYVPEFQDALHIQELKSREDFEAAGSPEDRRAEFEAYWHRLRILRALAPWACVIELSFFGLAFSIHLSLLYGLIRNKAVFMLPYLVVNMFAMVLYVVCLVAGVITLCIAATGGILAGIIALLIGGLILAISVYCWLIVRAAYLDIKELEPILQHQQSEESEVKMQSGSQTSVLTEDDYQCTIPYDLQAKFSGATKSSELVS